jgi:hypothetical protein
MCGARWQSDAAADGSDASGEDDVVDSEGDEGDEGAATGSEGDDDDGPEADGDGVLRALVCACLRLPIPRAHVTLLPPPALCFA